MPRPAAPSRPSPTPWIACLGLLAGTALLFSRSLGYDFINYDDPVYLTNNPRVQAGLTWDGLVWAFTGHADYWHPLTWVSHMLDWQLFGADATGHRAVNVLWHAVNAVLAFLLLRRLTGAWGLALFSAALFAWHPLRVESVVWVTERKDVMSGFFFLLTLLAYARYATRRASGQPAGPAYALTLALFLGGLMCKPSVVTLPLVLLALDLWPLHRLAPTPAAGWWRTHRGVLLEKIPFFALSAVIAVVTIRMQVASNAFSLAVPLADRLGNAVVSVVRYLGNFFWPVDLAFFYEHPGAWPAATVAGAVALLLLLTAWAWVRRRREPELLTGWLWFLAMLLPALGLLQVGVQGMADRYTYLPILGAQLAVLGIIARLPVPARAQLIAAGLVLTAAAGLTWRQQAFWRDSESLYQRARAMDPASAHAEAFLGYTHYEAGRLADAERHARRALELDPHIHWAWLTLANVQGQTGRLADAVNSYQRLIDRHPGYARGHYLRGLLLQQLGRTAEAEADLTRAAALLPDNAQVQLVLAEFLARQRKFTAAAAAYTRVVTLRPDSAEAHAGLGYMYALTGQREDAARHWQEALRLKPDFPGLRERLQQIRP
ncbi:cellulose synthase subunit BcsC [Lacunisphaera limnophila]|uniref:Cellulose synthase subunit BcsC n=1 Tax=Lacunisphaera limnophila TaxID=1838286 RepID=A0A1I7PHS8_9BACT|nr:tetratricopeptide repeat protein [Lacunisphaera limnophila]AOS43171.1 cellulose synthase subunit BcsC [Lacunisphaera limnophila]